LRDSSFYHTLYGQAKQIFLLSIKPLLSCIKATDSGHQSCHPALYTLQVPSALLNVAIVRRDLQV
jgi:hypothetical protein